MAKDSIIYDLLPCMGHDKFLIPDFRDVIDGYLATRPKSEERYKFVKMRMGVALATFEVDPYSSFDLLST